MLAMCAVAGAAYAQELNPGNKGFYSKDSEHYAKVTGQARTSNLIDHGGPVIVAPKVVCIFWGFGTGNSYTAAMQSFRNTGIRPYINMLAQYRSAGSGAA